MPPGNPQGELYHKPASESRFNQLRRMPCKGNEFLVIHEGSAVELAQRALADCIEGSTAPLDHGGPISLDSIVIASQSVVYCDQDFWFYDYECGIWIRVPESLVRRHVIKYNAIQHGKPSILTDETDGREYRRYKRLHLEAGKVGSALTIAKDMIHYDDWFQDAPIGMQFLDRFIWWDWDTGKIESTEPAPELRQRASYPFLIPDYHVAREWDIDDARWREICPPLYQILDGALPKRLEEWRAIQQRFGLAVLGLSQQIRGSHLWMCGEKGAGKSTIAAAFAMLFPAETRTVVQLHTAPTWETGALEHSRINVCAEVRMVRPGPTTEFFKEALTGGKIKVRDVGSASKEIFPGFFQINASNSIPKIPQDPSSVFDRFLLLNFEKFQGPADPDLLHKMSSHVGGLVMWALAGFEDCMQNGFLTPESSKELQRVWAQGSDSAVQWAWDCLVKQNGCAVMIRAGKTYGGAYEHYQKWCEFSGVERRDRRSLSNFKDSLVRAGFKIAPAGKHKIVSIKGYALKND